MPQNKLLLMIDLFKVQDRIFKSSILKKYLKEEIMVVLFYLMNMIIRGYNKMETL